MASSNGSQAALQRTLQAAASHGAPCCAPVACAQPAVAPAQADAHAHAAHAAPLARLLHHRLSGKWGVSCRGWLRRCSCFAAQGSRRIHPSKHVTAGWHCPRAHTHARAPCRSAAPPPWPPTCAATRASQGPQACRTMRPCPRRPTSLQVGRQPGPPPRRPATAAQQPAAAGCHTPAHGGPRRCAGGHVRIVRAAIQVVLPHSHDALVG